jgi:hypothetical protein
MKCVFNWLVLRQVHGATEGVRRVCKPEAGGRVEEDAVEKAVRCSAGKGRGVLFE